MKILIMTDSPFIPSGMGRLGREIAIGLAERGHEIGYIGWWHRQDIPPSLPYNIQFWWTNNSHYGSDILDQVVSVWEPDVLLTIGDFWWLSYIADPGVCRTRNHFQWCSYIPVDGEPVNGGIPPRLMSVIDDIDIPVAYTNYAKNAVLKSSRDEETRNRLQVIYHGVDTKTFKPDHKVRMQMRAQFEIQDKFVFLTVCRNQFRKNIPELFQAWKVFSELPETKGKVILWPHTFFDDRQGWNIEEIFDILQIRNQSILYYPSVAHGQSEQHLLPDEELAKLYQLSDAFLLMSGEGFGLPTFEAMATRLPCILLNHSASAELGAEGRAELVPVSMSITGVHLTQRPIPSVDDMVASMLKVFRNKAYRNSIAEAGHKFALQYPWSRVAGDWHNLFLGYEVPFVKQLQMEVVT